jgi:hypothetical protein
MTDAALLALIRATPQLQAINGPDANGNYGHDDLIAQAVPTYANVTAPKPFKGSDILGAVSQANVAKFADSPMFESIRQAVLAQDAEAVIEEATVAAFAGKITAAEQAAITAIVTATQTVPDTSVTREQVSRVLNNIRPRGHIVGFVEVTTVTKNPDGTTTTTMVWLCWPRILRTVLPWRPTVGTLTFISTVHWTRPLTCLILRSAEPFVLAITLALAMR